MATEQTEHGVITLSCGHALLGPQAGLLESRRVIECPLCEREVRVWARVKIDLTVEEWPPGREVPSSA